MFPRLVRARVGSLMTLAALGALGCGDSTGSGASGASGGGGATSGGGGEGATGGQGAAGGQGGEDLGCAPCSNGFVCSAADECASRFCDAGSCAPCLSNDDCASSGSAWECTLGVCTDGGPKTDGEGCRAAGDCASGFCVDGVCCDTACGDGDVDDCQACSEAAGAPSDGVCGPRSSGSSCGDADDSECDAADTCDGAGSCRENLAPAGAACSFDGLFCTGADTCDGDGLCLTAGAPCDATDVCDEAGGVCRAMFWINEIHYDNADPDVDEGIEFAGVAGLDVGNFGILLYDGASGAIFDGAPLGAILPTVVIPDESGGFGTLVFGFPGAPEGNLGLALVDEAGLVLHFISYGGAFTAADGPAAGMTSLDVGFAESEATVGTSIQLTGGPGNEPADFTWVVGPNSLGAVNAGQSF